MHSLRPGSTCRAYARGWRGDILVALVALVVGVLAVACPAATLTIWHPWAHGRSTIESLAQQYSRQTGVSVNVRSFNPQGYDPWQGGSQPDIIGLSYPTRGTIASNARRGRLHNIGPELQQGWYADLWPGPVSIFNLRGTEAPAGKPGIYGLPLTGFVRVFIYNRDLFARAGVDVPKTWSDMLLAAPALRRLGVVPLAGGMEGTHPAFPIIYERAYLGSHYLLESYFGRYSYTSNRWVQQFRIYEEMRQFHLTTLQAAQMSRADSEKYFLDGRCAMILDGPWFEPTRRRYAPRFTKWAVFGPPQDRRAPFLAAAPGGVAEGVVINARSNNKAAAVRFLRWMTQPPQQVRLANGLGTVPISETASKSSSLQSHIRAFAPHMRYAAVDLRYHESPQVLSRLYGGARNVIQGSDTPQQALSAVQRIAR